MAERSRATRPTSGPIRVLLIEDDADDAMLLTDGLAEAVPGRYAVTWKEDWCGSRAALGSESFDAILLDLNLPDASGVELVARAHEAAPDTPIVVMTGLDDGSVALASLQRGAQDYVVKGASAESVLARTIDHAIERERILHELEAVRQAQLEMRDQFLSHVSHELRTPLTAIHQFLTLVEDGVAGPVSGQQQEYLGIAVKNVEQLRDMIADLMEATRAQSGKLRIDPRAIDLVGPIVETAEAFEGKAADRKISIVTAIEPGLPPALIDDGRLRQVIGNLVSNALKFTPEGGRITVGAARWEGDPGLLRISVDDTGCGISPGGVQRIFERLYQEENELEDSRKGLGLGLYICREIVRSLGGRIWVESEQGRGSRFQFTVPAFELGRMLRPVLTVGDDVRDRLPLVSVKLTSPRASVPEAIRRRANGLIREAVVYEGDLVLPRRLPETADETLYVVLGSDETGAKALVERIRRGIDRCDDFDFSNVEAEVGFEMIDIRGGDDSRSLEDRIRAASQRVAELIR